MNTARARSGHERVLDGAAVPADIVRRRCWRYFPKVALGINDVFLPGLRRAGLSRRAFFPRKPLPRRTAAVGLPYSHCGVPYMAQMGQWYVPLWLFVLLPMPWSVNVPDAAAPDPLGGWGMYALTRRWGIGGFAASFAALAYMFNGVSLSCFQWGNYLASCTAGCRGW